MSIIPEIQKVIYHFQDDVLCLTRTMFNEDLLNRTLFRNVFIKQDPNKQVLSKQGSNKIGIIKQVTMNLETVDNLPGSVRNY